MTKKATFVVEFKLSQAEVTSFELTVKDCADINDAIYKAQDVARSALNLTCYDDAPKIKSINERSY